MVEQVIESMNELSRDVVKIGKEAVQLAPAFSASAILTFALCAIFIF